MEAAEAVVAEAVAVAEVVVAEAVAEVVVAEAVVAEAEAVVAEAEAEVGRRRRRRRRRRWWWRPPVQVGNLKLPTWVFHEPPFVCMCSLVNQKVQSSVGSIAIIE